MSSKNVTTRWMLLIDDVQFLPTKTARRKSSSTPSRPLLAKKSHIVMTSDTYPKGWRTSTSAWCRALIPGRRWPLSRLSWKCAWPS